MRSIRLSAISLIMLLFLLVSCNSLGNKSEFPKNIILVIGDGFGVSQLTTAKYHVGELHMEQLTYVGLVTTHSTSRITDSAAAATALSTGYKTDNGMLAMRPDGQPLRTVIHAAQDQGKSTGLVATCRIVHATPAAFAVHHTNRRDEEYIAELFLRSEIELILGGGQAQFLPESDGGTRSDQRNIVQEMIDAGYTYIDNEEDLSSISNYEKILGLLVHTNFPRYPERGDILSRMSRSAVEHLSQNNNGFFLMIEASQIDWAGHDNDADWMLQETLDFDNTVKEILDFVVEDGETLLIVTSDHETGGHTLVRNRADSQRHTDSFMTDYHTAVMVPVLAYGPGAQLFSGIYDNTRIAQLIFRFLNDDHPEFGK
jgi:alkaline phosphatase